VEIRLDIDIVNQACELLVKADYEVSLLPPHMLGRGALVAAWDEAKSRGYLLSYGELFLIRNHGVAVFEAGFPAPKHDSESEPNRWRRYLEAAAARACAEVAAAPPGTRNNTLNAAAYSLGRLAEVPGYDPGELEALLAEAGERAGLRPEEARAITGRALKAGAKSPRELAQLQRREVNRWR
jgi:hypothetical protein